MTTHSQAAAQTETPIEEALSPYPTSYFESFKIWWRNGKADSEAAERALLQEGLGRAGLPLLSSEDRGSGGRLRKVQLKGSKDRYMNMLEIGSETRDSEEMPIVVLSGYGAGMAFYFQNISALAGIPGTRTFLTDWLGMGRSGRPCFPSIKVKDPKSPEGILSRVSQAESFFVDSLEEWREKVGLKKLTIVGHSLGGYMSTAYALKYPERVHKLILVSPVGVPESPYSQTQLPIEQNENHIMVEHSRPTESASASLSALSAAAPEDSDSNKSEHLDRAKVSAELVQKQDEIVNDTVDTTASNNNSNGKIGNIPSKTPSGPQLNKQTRNWLEVLWEKNVSPFSILRGTTFFGPMLVSRYAKRRFATFDNTIAKSLYEYTYSIWTAKGSGEYVLAHVLAPRAYARYPLIRRIPDINVPVSFAYGEEDWMDAQGGRDALEKLKAKPDTPETKRQKAESNVFENPHSGHWVFLDNPEGFNKFIAAELKNAKAAWNPSADTNSAHFQHSK